MNYDISEVSRLFGMTPSGIRYYEDKKLISPTRSESGRRKYSREDLSGLMYLRKMRSLDISMDETKEYFHCDNSRSLKDVGEFTLSKVAAMREKATYFAMLADYLEKHGNALIDVDEKIGEVKSVIPSEFYLLSIDPVFGKTMEKQEQIASWIGASPMSQICSVHTLKGDRIEQRVSGFTIEKEYADKLALPLRERATVLPSVPSLYTVFRVTGKEQYGLGADEIGKLFKLDTRLDAWKHTRVVSKIFHTRLIEGTREKLYEVWINPI